MASLRAALKQSDLTRYAKGLIAAGVADFRVVVHPDGRHEIVAGKLNPDSIGPDPDELLK